MSVLKKEKGVYEVRWREGGRHKSAKVHGSDELAKKVERKKLSLRDENRHLDVRKEVNYSMSDLIDRYWLHYGSKKASADREKSIVAGIRAELGRMFVREVDGVDVQRWYENLTGKRGLAENTAVRHFNVMHHLMKKASTIWSKETGLERNPADMVEVRRPDDSRERFLSKEELERLKVALDEKMFRKGTKDLNQTNLRMRLIVLIAVSTGMRSSEVHRLRWSDVLYREELIAVRAKLKKGKERYVPMTSELAEEIRRYPAVIGEDRIFPPTRGDKEWKAETGRELRGCTHTSPDSKLLVPRSAPHLCVLVHDERWRSLRTRQASRSFEHQDDRALREAWTCSYHQDRNNGQGALEHDGVEAGSAGSSTCRKVRVAEMYAICTSG